MGPPRVCFSTSSEFGIHSQFTDNAQSSEASSEAARRGGAAGDRSRPQSLRPLSHSLTACHIIPTVGALKQYLSSSF